MKLKIYLTEAWMCSEFGYQRPMSNKKGLRVELRDFSREEQEPSLTIWTNPIAIKNRYLQWFGFPDELSSHSGLEQELSESALDCTVLVWVWRWILFSFRNSSMFITENSSSSTFWRERCLFQTIGPVKLYFSCDVWLEHLLETSLT